MGEGGVPVPESVLKKQKRSEEWALVKKQELEVAKKKNAANRKLIYNRAKQYAKEYAEQVITSSIPSRLCWLFFFSLLLRYLWVPIYAFRRGSWSVWSVRQDWREDSMSTQRRSCSSSSESVGKMAVGLFDPCDLMNKVLFWLSFQIFRINAMAPQTKKILQLLRLRQVIYWCFLFNMYKNP